MMIAQVLWQIHIFKDGNCSNMMTAHVFWQHYVFKNGKPLADVFWQTYMFKDCCRPTSTANMLCRLACSNLADAPT
jgi:hypothetical protein